NRIQKRELAKVPQIQKDLISMTTVTQTKPQTKSNQLDAIDGEFDYLIGLRPQTLTGTYYQGYKAAADKQGQCPF
ncbi:MAG: hypothetical protein ACKPCP_21760, partial [Sphaerospermopsis kisseleviana]